MKLDKLFSRDDTLKPWVNKHGQIQLNAMLATGGMFNRIVINLRTHAKHSGPPPKDRWEVLQVHPIEDTTADVRELARGYIRMHATLFGCPYVASYDGFRNGGEVERG